ncbi:Mitochondrial glycoprotein family protein [Raphanus sativus]|uniref:Uncharacterized protein At2g39795, mitochondrial-like n=1 Tax=Raphanus sativus TaxID=3726 RepID=A0A9W3DGD6_RAPSA|nr:uncharacterized protein At2g39795, mitochondrial-like [Raphanus sativus]KAJ4907587.1 Mitochondrial glycoprotein family protein [Raphanus sativus]
MNTQAMSLLCGASSSTVAARPFRAVRSPVSLQTGAQRVTLGGGGSHQFSRSSSSSSLMSFSRGWKLSAITADANLVSVLESEIEGTFVNEDPHDDDLDKLPEWFHFQILDSLGERDIYLTREFEDETILVQVIPPPQLDDEELLKGIPMIINVSKDDDDICIEFAVKAFVNEIIINAVSVLQPHEPRNPYQGPEFDDLDENLQKAFHRFLEIRGIKPTITEVVAGYLVNKASRERFQWLKDVKSFVDM